MSVQSEHELIYCVDCKESKHMDKYYFVDDIGVSKVICPECFAKRKGNSDYILCTICQKSINMRDIIYAQEPIDNEGITYCALPYCNDCYNKTTFDTFKINELIEMRLVGERTVIFINDKEFSQCAYLLLNIPNKEVEMDDTVNIDEAGLKYSFDMETNRNEYKILPETEFWGHCSNIQAWVENDYHPSILHSNLAVPLLKRLCSDDIKIFHSLLYHLDDMWKAYKTKERRQFVYEMYGDLINANRQRYGINSKDLQKSSLFFKDYIIISEFHIYGMKWRRLVSSRELRKQDRRMEREEKKRLSFQRRRNYWELRIYGKDLVNRNWLRRLRDHDVSIVSDEDDYIPYLWSKYSNTYKWTKVEIHSYYGDNKITLTNAYISEGITHIYRTDWVYRFCNGWNGSHDLYRCLVRMKDGTFVFRHLVL